MILFARHNKPLPFTFSDWLHGSNEGFEAEDNLLQRQNIAGRKSFLVALQVLLQESLTAAGLGRGRCML